MWVSVGVCGCGCVWVCVCVCVVYYVKCGEWYERRVREVGLSDVYEYVCVCCRVHMQCEVCMYVCVCELVWLISEVCGVNVCEV